MPSDRRRIRTRPSRVPTHATSRANATLVAAAGRRQSNRQQGRTPGHAMNRERPPLPTTQMVLAIHRHSRNPRRALTFAARGGRTRRVVTSISMRSVCVATASTVSLRASARTRAKAARRRRPVDVGRCPASVSARTPASDAIQSVSAQRTRSRMTATRGPIPGALHARRARDPTSFQPTPLRPCAATLVATSEGAHRRVPIAQRVLVVDAHAHQPRRRRNPRRPLAHGQRVHARVHSGRDGGPPIHRHR